MKKGLLFLIFACTFIFNTYSQQIWQKKITGFSYKKIADNPISYQNLTLDKSYFLEIVKDVPNRNENITSFSEISLPVNDNDFEIFKILETSNFNSELSKKFPSIKSYVAKSLHSNKTARLSYSSYSGLTVTIYTNDETLIIKPTDLKVNDYVFYSNKENQTTSEFECNTIEKAKSAFKAKSNLTSFNNDGFLRKYRLAVATTGEYSNFFLTGNEGSDQERKATVLAAINNSLTRINGIFERDFGITMELIDNNDDIIFLDGNTDPFTSSYNSELQNTLDTTIGSENYDVGHLFVYENSIYGNAGCIACVCTDGEKGSAFTAHSEPDSDNFNMIASHEFGHQFGGYHVQSSSNCRSSAELQEVEPGSGSSIMGYAGICSPNVQENPDDYFNYVDIRDVIEWTRNNSSCAELISTGNNDPVANAGNDYFIPISTPFILTGSATDNNSDDILTYCWEQNDPENPNSSDYPQPTWLRGPLFRSKLPIDTPVRHIPQLQDVISGNLTPTWEVLPSVERDLNFAFTVRDNAISGPKTDSDLMTISVVDNDGAFTVTSQNETETWVAGETKEITWHVAETNLSPINVSNVDILLSIDGGYTYPYTMASNISNNGTAQVIVPTISESTIQARIMVKPVNNIFYAINPIDLEINISEFALTFNNTTTETCKPNNLEYRFTYNTYLGFNDTTSFKVENLHENLIATFSPEIATDNNTEVTLIITNTNNIEIGNFNFNVIATANSIERKNSLSFNVYEEINDSPSLLSPENMSTSINTSTDLQWESNLNIDEYTLQIATDKDFTNIIETNSTIETTYNLETILDNNTTYYWKVFGENTCGNGLESAIYSFTTECYTPTELSVTNVTINSATISWVDSSNTSSWEIEVIESDKTPTGSGIAVNENPFLQTSLKSGTNYNVYIRANCSATNYSEWTEAVNFTTLSNFCNGDKFYDTGGANGEYSNNEYYETTISPLDADIVEITFDNFNIEYGYDYLNVYDGNNSDAPLIGSFTGTNSPGIIRSKTGQGITFAFYSDGYIAYPGWEASVECITVKCPEPSDFTYNNLTHNSIDLSWVTNGDEFQWEIEYGTTGFSKGNGTSVVTKTNPITINELTPDTYYDFYLTALCGETTYDNTSFSVGPIAIKTPCNTINAPYTFDVEKQDTDSVIENCWQGTPEYNEDDYFWYATNQTYSSYLPSSPHSGNKYFSVSTSYYSTYGNEANLLTPVFNTKNLTSPTLHFYAFLLGEGTESLNIDIYNQGQWINNVYSIEGQQQSSNQDDWKEYYINLSEYSGEVQVRFRAISGVSYNTTISIDDIGIIEKPDCIKPDNLTFTNTTAKSITLTNLQTSDNTLENFTLEYGITGFSLGNGTQTITTEDTTIINNLEENTSYDFYIKSNCSNNTSSEWVGPFTTKTYSDFCNGTHFYDSGGIDGDYEDNEDNTTTIYPSEGFDQITAIFNSFQLEGCCDYLRIYDGTSENATLIGSYNGTNSPGTISSTNTDGALTFVFTSDGSVDYSGWDATIICENSECLSPKNIIASNITSTSTNLEWEIRNEESNWIIEYGETGFTPNNGTEVNTNSNTYTLTGLKSNTTYDVYVKTECDNDVTTPYPPVTFTTEPDYCNGDHFYDTGGADDGYSTYESYTQTIYPSEGNNQTSINFNTLDLGYYSYLKIYNGENIEASLIAEYERNSEFSEIISSNNVTGALTFEFTSNYYTSTGWDATITCENITCKTPTDIITSNNTISSVELSWTSLEEETNWVIEYGETGFTPGTGTEINTNTNPYVLESLQSATTYDIYVKTDCNTGTSEYSNVITVTTESDYCAGDHFYDTGGAEANYNTYDNYIKTIYPSQGNNTININFNTLNLSYNTYLTIYDGENIEAPLIVKYDAYTSDFSEIISSNNITGALTIQFSSGYYSAEGWDATVTCENIICYKPQNLITTNSTINTTDISWTTIGNETEWIIEYGETGFTSGTGTEINTSTNPFTLGGLTSATSYDVYVKANCESETSDYSSVYTFTTESDYCAGDHFYDTGGADGNYSTYEDYTTTIYPSEGNNQTTINFNTLDLATYSYLNVYNGENTEAPLIIEYERGSDFSEAISSNNTTGSLTFEFSSRYYSATGWDAIISCQTNTCQSPLELTPNNITTNSVDLNWTTLNEETSWVIEYGETGFTPGTGTETNTTTNPFTLDGLIPATSYDVYIKANCESETSEHSTINSFTTLPDYCNGDHFYDTGGVDDDYSTYEDYTKTFYPSEGNNQTTINFNTLELATYSYLNIYNGENTEAPLIVEYERDSEFSEAISSNNATGALTIEFSSRYYSATGWDASITCQMVTCPKPYDLSISDVNTYYAQLNWDTIGKETNWIIEYGETGFVEGNGTIINVDTNSYKLSDLTPSTIYDVYVKTNCNDSVSEPSLISFTTDPNYCNGTHFYDTGGLEGNYSSNENYTKTIYPSEGYDKLAIIFNTLEISYYDYLYIYDGEDINAPLIHQYTDIYNVPSETITSNNDLGALTFVFTSNSYTTRDGWDATIICEKSTCISPESLTASNETTNSIDLQWTPRGTESNWIIEYGEKGFIPGTGSQIHTDINEFTLDNLNSQTTYDVYVIANCNTETSEYLTSTSFITKPDYCNGDHFYDTGGPDGDYTANEYYTTTIYPDEGLNQLAVTFNSLGFGNYYGYLYVYDGETTSSNLIAEYTYGSDFSKTIKSNNETGALTFLFDGGYYTGSGWDATITCNLVNCHIPKELITSKPTKNSIDLTWSSLGEETNWIIEYGETGFTPGTGTEINADNNPYTLNNLNANTTYDAYVKANCGSETSDYSPVTIFTTIPDYCNGDHFYDTGGSDGNYARYEEYTSTIYSDEGFNQISVDFNSLDIAYYSYLRIYDGEDTNAPLLAEYTNTTEIPETIISNNLAGALTFSFYSSYSTSTGWDATINCLVVPCAKPTNLSTSKTGSTFTSLDWSVIGEETNWIIEYGETGFTPGTGTEVSTNTKPFVLDGLNTNTLYDAYVKTHCSDETSEYSTLTTFKTTIDYCKNGKFYDTGGEFGEYSNNENYTTTIYPSDGYNQVSISFNSIDLEYSDYLIVYDGEDTNAPFIDQYSDTVNTPDDIISNNSSGALTFVFNSNSYTTADGWNASVTCLNITCPKPTDLLASNTTTNTTELSWLAGGNETGWTIEYGINGFTPGEGTIIETSSNSYLLEDLNSVTEYQVYIKANCTEEDSEYSNSYTFITESDYCAGDVFLYDGYYSSNTEYTTTIYPSEDANQVSVTFNYLNIGYFDTLTIYDGEDTNSPILTTYNDIYLNSEAIVSNNMSGALTFSLSSSNTYNLSSWSANITCQVSNCNTPTNLSINTIKANAVDLQWIANDDTTSWILEYGETGFEPGTGIEIIDINTTTYTLEGLNSKTTYDAYIRTSCEDTTSSYSNSVTFTTKINYCAGNHFYDTGLESENYNNSENYTKTIYPSDGFNQLAVNFSSFNLEDGFDKLSIYDGTDSSATLLGEYTGINSPETVISNNDEGALTFVFFSDDSVTLSGWDATITCQNSSCPTPTDISTSNVTHSEATIDWEIVSESQTYSIEYGLGGYTQGNGTIVEVSTTSHSLTNLSSDSSYDYYIKTNCSTSDENTPWIGPFAFNTLCNKVISAPFYEDFSSNTTPDCWVEYGNENWNYNTLADFDAINANDFSPEKNTNYAWIDGSAPNNQTNSLKTIPIDLSNLSHPYIEFAVFSQNTFDNTFNNLIVKLYDSKNNSIILLDLQEATTEDGWEKFYFNLSDYTFEGDVIQIEFIVTENSIGNSFFNDILIDEIKIENDKSFHTTDEEVPVVLNPLGLDTDPQGDTLTVISINDIDITSEDVNIIVDNGTVTVVSGLITFFPEDNFFGKVTIPYVISDGNGGTNTGNEFITVNPVNDKPIAIDDILVTDEEKPIVLNPLNLDTDIEGDTLIITSINDIDITSEDVNIIVDNGTVTVVSGLITFFPEDNFFGKVTIPYVISDGNGGTDTAKEVITVNPINDSLDTTDEDIITNLNYYPNPVINILNIESSKIITKIEVYNILGQRLINLNLNNKKFTKKLDLNNISSGTYLIRVYADNKIKQFKIIKK